MNLNELRLRRQIDRGTILAHHEPIQMDIEPNSAREHYVGMSSIDNDPCDLWRWYHDPQPPGEMEAQGERIFRLGKLVEAEIKLFIRLGGGIVEEEQREFSDFDNCYRGHWDGRWDSDFVLEVKSANYTNFNNLDSGPLKVKSPYYYAQVQEYMLYSGLRQSMLVVYDKSTGRVSVQQVNYEESHARYLRSKAYAVIYSQRPCMIPETFRTYKCSECNYCN